MVPATKKRVLLDCDGVLSDFLTKALEIINTTAMTNFQHAHVHDFDICESLGLPHMWDTLKAACGEKDFCLNLELIPGAQAGVSMLRASADVYCLTSPMSVPNWAYDRNIWLEKHFEITNPFVVHTEAKHIVTGDIFVDDKVENVRVWAEHNPKSLAILFDAPYNRKTEINRANVVRAFSWDDVVKLSNSWLHPNMLPLDKSMLYTPPPYQRIKW